MRTSNRGDDWAMMGYVAEASDAVWQGARIASLLEIDFELCEGAKSENGCRTPLLHGTPPVLGSKPLLLISFSTGAIFFFLEGACFGGVCYLRACPDCDLDDLRHQQEKI